MAGRSKTPKKSASPKDTQKFFENQGTFKKRPEFIDKGGRRSSLFAQAQASLGAGEMQTAVCVPPGEDESEWLAVNTIDFYHKVQLLYGWLKEFCTKDACPLMSGGPQYEYYWATDKKLEKLSAPEYVAKLMEWIEQLLEDEELFPSTDKPFNEEKLRPALKTIFKRLFRVFAHMYHSHFEHFKQFEIEAHLNTAFKHFAYFITEFDLVSSKELEPLKSLMDKMLDSKKKPSKS